MVPHSVLFGRIVTDVHPSRQVQADAMARELYTTIAYRPKRSTTNSSTAARRVAPRTQETRPGVRVRRSEGRVRP
jgi:hypothetical protein